MSFYRSPLFFLLLAAFVATVACQCATENIENKSLDQIGETAKNDMTAFLKKLLTSYKDLTPDTKTKVAGITKVMQEQMNQIVDITKFDTKNLGKLGSLLG